uniref:Uncharacterized protein n=1 Tax=Arion vulgaris TaxID=1028688 RepID=A0A0B6ZWU2_9EUPU
MTLGNYPVSSVVTKEDLFEQYRNVWLLEDEVGKDLNNGGNRTFYIMMSYIMHINLN